MAILIDSTKRVLVQGMTGREGMARAKLMQGFGTQLVAAVTPGRGGQVVEGIPVFDTVREAWEARGPLDASVLFVPAPQVKNAALEAIAAGVKLLVIVPDRVPIYDVLAIAAAAREAGAHFLGPNTLGVLSPGRGVLGMMGGSAQTAREWFKPGPVGVMSRSGGITSSIGYYLGRAGIGVSTLAHVGGDAVVGLPHPEVARLFQADPETKLIVMFGEIGGSQEERVAEMIAAGEITKPVIAFIGGKAAKSGTRFSHAGAIVEGNRGTHAGKVDALRQAGAQVVESFGDLPTAVQQALHKLGVPMTETWKTAITHIKPNEIRLRGYAIADLMGQTTFAQAIYLALRGELPTAPVGRLLDAMLVSSIDHGVTPPSTQAARLAASTGAPLNAAVAVGLLSINKHHGGAVYDCMGVLHDGLQRVQASGRTPEAVALEIVDEYRAAKRRMAGFGHRVHSNDPRTARLLSLAAEAGIAAGGVAMMRALEKAYLERMGKPLPVNVDGAIAALLIDLQIPQELANAFFFMARVPGLVAQVYEEQMRQPPMRQIDPREHEYDGPAPRTLEK